MTVVAACLYRHGKRVRAVAIDEKVDCPPDKSAFVWIGICDLTDDEMRTLKEQYDLHPLAIEDAVNARQLPKVDGIDVGRFVALSAPDHSERWNLHADRTRR